MGKVRNQLGGPRIHLVELHSQPGRASDPAGKPRIGPLFKFYLSCFEYKMRVTIPSKFIKAPLGPIIGLLLFMTIFNITVGKKKKDTSSYIHNF